MPLPDPPYQNSAGRLLGILRALKRGGSALGNLNAIAEKGAVSPAEQMAAAFSLLNAFQIAYVDFLRELQDHDMDNDQRELLLQGLAGLADAIYPRNLEAGFRAVTVPEEALLELCASKLLPQEIDLQESYVELIRKSIASLRTHVNDAKISPTLRKVLLELIRLSEDAISRYNIHGARGLKKAFKAMLGETIELYGSASDKKGREALQESAPFKAITKHLHLFDGIAARLQKYKPLLERGTLYFLGGPES